MNIMLLVLGLVSSMADGDSAMTRGDYEAAIGFYRAEVAAAPAAYEARFRLARALALSKHRDEAIAIYTELLAASPTNSDVLLGRGRVHAWEGRWAEAEADLTAATLSSPTYADAWSALGDMYQWSDRPGDAVNAYGKWIELKPEDPAAWIARGRAYRAADNLAAARLDFEAARTSGADTKEINSYLLSLERRRQPPEAQVPEGYRWSAGVSYGLVDFSPTRDRWSDYSASIRRHFKYGSLAVEYLGARRFLIDDNAWALDAYADLWPRAYVNLRYQNGPEADLYPDHAYRAELFQGVGKGWELSSSYDHMDFGRSNVDMYSAGIGKYIGNYYLRARTLFIPGTGFLSLSHSGLVRYYYSGNADDYVELKGGWSRGGDLVRNVVTRTRGHSGSMSFVKYFSPRWGIKFSFGYGDEENSYVDRSISASLYTRW